MKKKIELVSKFRAWHKLGLFRPSLCLGPEKNFQVRVTNLPYRRLSSSHGRKDKGLTTNIYTGGQVQHSKD